MSTVERVNEYFMAFINIATAIFSAYIVYLIVKFIRHIVSLNKTFGDAQSPEKHWLYGNMHLVRQFNIFLLWTKVHYPVRNIKNNDNNNQQTRKKKRFEIVKNGLLIRSIIKDNKAWNISREHDLGKCIHVIWHAYSNTCIMFRFFNFKLISLHFTNFPIKVTVTQLSFFLNTQLCRTFVF